MEMIETPPQTPDLVLQLTEDYATGLATYTAALADPADGETEEMAVDRTYAEPMNRMADRQLSATTREGAIAALHLADQELGDFDRFVTHLIRAALGYLEGQSKDSRQHKH